MQNKILIRNLIVAFVIVFSFAAVVWVIATAIIR
jgi:hypothetical protein